MLRTILLALIIVAIVGRFIALDWVPPHLSNDEIGAAYDAYSVSKTLRDEHNQFLPILFQSHGIYRSTLAVYITIPTIMLLGNSDFSARLPSAILGTLTIIFLGLLVLTLTNNRILSFATSLILAFSPFHFATSRATIESNYAIFFVVLGIYLFFYGLKYCKNWATIACFVAFTLSIYGYYTEWGLTPLIMGALLFFYRKSFQNKKIYVVGILIFVCLLIPLGNDFFHHSNSSRASTEFINKDLAVARFSEQKNFNLIQKGQIVAKAVVDKYSNYTSLGYLFFYGANILPRDNPYQVGFFLSPFIAGFIIGLIKLKKYFGNHANFIYFWFFISPLIPSLTQGDLSSVRIFPMVIPLTLIVAAGSLELFFYIKNNNILKVLIIGLLSLSLFYFFMIYVFHVRLEKAEGYQYGFKQIAMFIKNHEEFEKYIIDPRFGDKEFYFSGVPHVYIPFYLQLDPRGLQNSNRSAQGTFFGKYEFRIIDWGKEKPQKNYLYVVPHDNLPGDNLDKILKQIYEIQLPNKKVEFKLFTLK